MALQKVWIRAGWGLVGGFWCWCWSDESLGELGWKWLEGGVIEVADGTCKGLFEVELIGWIMEHEGWICALGSYDHNYDPG